MNQENDDFLNTGTADSVQEYLKRLKQEQEARKYDEEGVRLYEARTLVTEQRKAREITEKRYPAIHINSITTLREGDILCVAKNDSENSVPYILHMDVTTDITGKNTYGSIIVFSAEDAYTEYTVDGPLPINYVGEILFFDSLDGKQQQQTYGELTTDFDEFDLNKSPFTRTSAILTAAHLTLDKLKDEKTRDSLATTFHTCDDPQDAYGKAVRKNFPRRDESADIDGITKQQLLEQRIVHALLQKN